MRFVLRRMSEPCLLQWRNFLPAKETICEHFKGPASSTNSREARDVQVVMGIEDAQNPQFLANHNVASHGLKLFRAVKK